jgi:hypothetical protein
MGEVGAGGQGVQASTGMVGDDRSQISQFGPEWSPIRCRSI